MFYRLSVAKSVVCDRAHPVDEKAKVTEGQWSKVARAPSGKQLLGTTTVNSAVTKKPIIDFYYIIKYNYIW